jgi:ElaB/YqjD/DUF883 family membrane-anchored ribosome-binding protein
MSARPKNLDQAIDELDGGNEDSSEGFKKRFEQELKSFEETLKNLKPQLDEMRERLGDDAKKVKARVESEVGENPWAALGLASLVFFILGFLFGFKTSRRSD